jgi:hypothetical protein
MMRRRLQPLLWPISVLIAGALTGGVAEIAVGRWQAYSLYGLARPVADLLLIIGAVWLAAAVIEVARNRRS